MNENAENEMFLVSSDTESDFGDEKFLFYEDDEPNMRIEINRLKKFDRDHADLSKEYQEQILPKLNEKCHNFMKWLIESDLLCSTVICPNAIHDRKCSTSMEYVLALGLNDLYQLRCKNCFRKESVRKGSIFYGIECNIRSIIRLFYAWVKGVDIDIMCNMLSLDFDLVGQVYNRAAELALRCMNTDSSPEFGGPGQMVLIDVYPRQKSLLQNKMAVPVLFISEIDTIPQKYWLEPLELWDKTSSKETEIMIATAVKYIFKTVLPGSTLVLPNNSLLPLHEAKFLFYDQYPRIKILNEFQSYSTLDRPLSVILDIIWKNALNDCELAQFSHQQYIRQFLIRQLWKNKFGEGAFSVLINFIQSETRWIST